MLRVNIELLGSNPETGCWASEHQEMSISSSRCEDRFSQENRMMRMSHDEEESSVSCVPHEGTACEHTVPHFSV